MGRRSVDVLLMVGVVGVAFVVWLGGLGFTAAGLALDHPPVFDLTRRATR